MKKLIVITHPNQVNGFRLAGIEAFGSDQPEVISKMIKSWLEKKQEILLAIDDGLFSLLDKQLVNQIYRSDALGLVTIPTQPIPSKKLYQQQIYDMIRHATGVQLKFKGESNGHR
jgi:vacuolar-type H+-ATPase subunit F/Vma7